MAVSNLHEAALGSLVISSDYCPFDKRGKSGSSQRTAALYCGTPVGEAMVSPHLELAPIATGDSVAGAALPGCPGEVQTSAEASEDLASPDYTPRSGWISRDPLTRGRAVNYITMPKRQMRREPPLLGTTWSKL